MFRSMDRSRGSFAGVLGISESSSSRRIAIVLALLFLACFVAVAAPQTKAATPQAKPTAPADAEYQKGLSLLKAGDIAGASRAFERTVQLAPKSAEAHNSLGWILFSQGENDKAIQEL